jgi:acetolactate synthase-1/2/3 large subunit
VARDVQERGAFQEIDYRRMFGPLAKWVAQVDDAARIPEFIARAFHTANAGRPGPVVLALPEDVLTESALAEPALPQLRCAAAPSRPALAELQDALQRARAPLLVLGGSAWSEPALEAVHAFARRAGLPVACSFRRQDLFDHRDPHYAGELGLGMNPALARRVAEADVLLAVGARLGDVPSAGYTLLQVPRPRQRLIHVLPGAEDLNAVYQAHLAIHASLDAFADALKGIDIDGSAWSAWRAAARDDYLAWLRPPRRDTELDPAEIVIALKDMLPRDAVLTNGAGNYSAWAHRYYQFSQPRCQLAPTSGAMGYGLPAAIAAKLAQPHRAVVCLAGDGCLLMSAQELATAVQFGAAVVVLVFNNGMFGTIRMHQEANYPGRPMGTALQNPDFVALARAFGAEGEQVLRARDFRAALERGLRSALPYVIELKVDPDLISPRTTLAAMRADAAAEAMEGDQR